MIAKALTQIVKGLNDYLNDVFYPNFVDQAKITNLKKDSGTEISVTLINVEEDKVYKNHLNSLPDRLHDSIDPINPLGGISMMRVNLYVLFAFESAEVNAYLDSLTRLTHVLRYFQAKPYKEIIILGTPKIPATATEPEVPATLEQRFNLEISYHNISLEDSNNMWSNLGGEQKPYAMYQIKMLELEPATEVSPIAVLKHPRISNPKYDPDGEIIYDVATGDPFEDDNQIQHS